MFGSALVLVHDLRAALPVLDLVADRAPEDSEVKAGWTALIIVLLLVAAVAVIGVSLTRQLKKAQQAKDAGVYGDPVAQDPVKDETTD